MKASNIIRFPIERRGVRPKTVTQIATRRAPDALLEHMRRRGLPLTRSKWLELNFPDGVPDPLPGGYEASIPEELQ